MEQEITFEMNLDGRQVTCTVLFTFSSEETGANYMLYTPDPPDGKETRLMAARFDPSNLASLYPLQGDADRAVVQSFIDYVSAQTADGLPGETGGDVPSEEKPCS
ncbi:MAG: hypothetical protein VB055_11220 [Oscillospiraceae bacterium]|nr:hypothetical protein [Oscillospiraceae bacterium]